jgi:hypothetical protein
MFIIRRRKVRIEVEHRTLTFPASSPSEQPPEAPGSSPVTNALVLKPEISGSIDPHGTSTTPWEAQ